MRKFFKGMILILAVMVGLGLFVPKAFALNAFQINVYENIGWSSTAGGYPALTDDVQYIVFDAGSTTLETIYSDTASTAKGNPVMEDVFDDDAKIKFWTATADTTVDIIVTDNTTGSSIFLNGVTTSTRTAIIDNRPFVPHVCAFWYSSSTDYQTDTDWYESATYFDTHIIFPINTVIKDIMYYVHASTGTDTNLSVGTFTDVDGILDDVNLEVAVPNVAGTTRALYVPEMHISDAVAEAEYGIYGLMMVPGDSISGEGINDSGYIYSGSSERMVALITPEVTTIAESIVYEIDSTHPLGGGIVYIFFELMHQ